MKQKKVSFILGITISIIFILLFTIQYLEFYATKPSFPKMIEQVVKYSEEKQWSKADKTFRKVENKWNNAQALIAVKYADVDYSFLIMAITRLKQEILSKNISGVRKEGKVCIIIFKNITSISPKP